MFGDAVSIFRSRSISYMWDLCVCLTVFFYYLFTVRLNTFSHTQKYEKLITCCGNSITAYAREKNKTENELEDYHNLRLHVNTQFCRNIVLKC